MMFELCFNRDRGKSIYNVQNFIMSTSPFGYFEDILLIVLLYSLNLNVGLLLLTEYFSTLTELKERVSLPLLLLGITWQF